MLSNLREIGESGFHRFVHTISTDSTFRCCHLVEITTEDRESAGEFGETNPNSSLSAIGGTA